MTETHPIPPAAKRPTAGAVAVPAILQPFGWCARHIDAMIRADAGFLDFLIAGNWLQLHLTGLALSLAPHNTQHVSDSPAELARLLRTRSVKAVVRAIRGSCPPGIVRALHRLPRRQLARQHYVRLIELLDEPNAAKVLRHLDSIGAARIMALSQLDSRLRHPNILKLARSPAEVRDLGIMIDAIRHLAPKVDEGELHESLARTEDWEQVRSWFRRWRSVVALPAPPWSGTELLRPLTTIGEVEATAREFENCLDRNLEPAVAGSVCFYRWHGSPAAVIAIERCLLAFWRVREIRGRRNASVPVLRREKILAAFEGAGIGRRSLSVNNQHLSDTVWF